MADHNLTLLFDFDGTVSLGHGPVLAYARLAAESLSATHAEEMMQQVRMGLALEPSSVVATPGPVPTPAADGYILVKELAQAYGVEDSGLNRAYHGSRAQLATALAPIEPVPGLAAFLGEARDHANIVLATNSPEVRMSEALQFLGLTGAFDVLYTSVGKPSGLDAVLDEWMPYGPLLSIGDIWANDLAPAHARGAQTALVGRGSVVPEGAEPTFRADDLADLFPQITRWWTPGSSF
jgi:FMN phosphatase YigB (HAD superfamily)